MTTDPTTAMPGTGEPRTGRVPTAADLVNLVIAIPGVSGIEPSVTTALHTLDARIRRTGAGPSHFGLLVDREAGTVTVEVCVDRSRPIRDSVRDIQLTLHRALREALPDGTEIHVRVQSLDLR